MIDDEKGLINVLTTYIFYVLKLSMSSRSVEYVEII